jgi:hypothetical protein
MKYTHIKTIATDWCVCHYYEIPSELKFTATWQYGGGWIDKIPKTKVKQTACYVKITLRRSDKSFFSFDILDKEWTTIRGKNCKGIPNYLKIYNDLIGG